MTPFSPKSMVTLIIVTESWFVTIVLCDSPRRETHTQMYTGKYCTGRMCVSLS